MADVRKTKPRKRMNEVMERWVHITFRKHQATQQSETELFQIWINDRKSLGFIDDWHRFC
jgi:hypothetical protein